MTTQPERIGIGVIGGGYMGKAHAVALHSVGAQFETSLRPRLVAVCGASPASGARHARRLGFEEAAQDWRAVVDHPEVEAVTIASPPETHREIALAAFERGLHVFCEKPLGTGVEDGEAMLGAARRAGTVHMMGFNYVRTPATQFARQLIEGGRIGRPIWCRAEHVEDFGAPGTAPTWRTAGQANGTMGDLAPHPVNLIRALMGDVTEVCAVVETVTEASNDDQAQMMLRFEGGAMGHLFASRAGWGRKMGYAYEVHGTEGAIRFDQEDQNALWLFTREGPEAEQGFRKILAGPLHPDYLAFCQGPAHGTGYQDQIVIEMKDWLAAIEVGGPRWPSFEEGLAVSRTIAAARRSSASRRWEAV